MVNALDPVPIASDVVEVPPYVGALAPAAPVEPVAPASPFDASNCQYVAFGGLWLVWPRSEVIRSIENGTNTFFTLVGGKRADVGVVSGPNGKYVRTHADGYYNDNLLALPECP